MRLLVDPNASDPARRAALDLRGPVGAVLDPRGRTVRCTPRCRTVVRALAGGARLYRKIHRGGRARVEWRVLGELADLGFRVPARAYLARARGISVIAVLAVPGRSLDALLAEASRDRLDAAAVAFLAESVASMVRRLHDAGWVHRDLYWNHLFAAELSPRAGEPWIIDVERALRPWRWRQRRWRVKDLAALTASWPDPPPPRTLALRFLRTYLGGLDAGWKDLARAVVRKAGRVRAHRPRYG